MSNIPKIPGYEILEKIGVGSTSTVWRARQESLARDVAIKVLHPALWSQMEEADAFLAEAHSVALLKSRHVIQVYDVARLEDTAYIVMEYVDGCTLTQHLDESGGKLPRREAMQIVAAIADALRDAWQSAGMIHRDIKPDNIIIESDGSVKLADLGLARQIDAESAEIQNQEIVGTPNYMSPEQAEGAPDLSPATDMYGLGATLYQMLTGKIPFAGRSVEQVLDAQISEQLPWPQDIDTQIPLSYAQFIARLMMKAPQNRYASWNRVYEDAVKLSEGRMLMVKLPQQAKSTIARAGELSSGIKKAIKIGKSKQRASQLPTYSNKRPAIPEWLTTTLNLCRLFCFLAALWLLLAKPLLRSYETTHTPDSPSTSPNTRDQPAATTTRHHQTDALATQAEAPYDPMEQLGLLDDTQESDQDPDVAYPQNIDPDMPLDSVQEPLATLDNTTVIRHLLEMLVQQKYRGAEQHWTQYATQFENAYVRETLTAMLEHENLPIGIIGGSLHNTVGQEIQLSLEGQTTTLQIEKIDQDFVHAMVATQNGSSLVMLPRAFRISQLEPSEQLRLLRRTDSRFTPYAIGLTALQAADYTQAQEIAALMGPLESAVQHFAEERIDAVSKP